MMLREKPAGAKNQVEDTEAGVEQEQDNMTHAEIGILTSRVPEKTLEKMLVAIGDSLSDLVSSDHWEDGEDEDGGEPDQGKLSDDEQPGWVMDAITKTVQLCMKRFWQKQRNLDELTHLEW
jgi:hypothetical protein